MNQFEVIADRRVDQGSGASRRLRRAGLVPGIVYGAGHDPVPVQTSHKDLMRQLDNEAFYSHVLTVVVEGTSERVVLKDLQRHPFRPQILHFDLLRVAEDQELTMRVPLHFINEERCVGVKTGGGLLEHQMTEVEVVCLPRDLPEYIEVDVSALEVGTTLHVADLQLPPGVQVAALRHGGDPSQPVVSVQLPRVATEGEEGEQEAGGEAPEAGPAAGA